MRKPSSNLPSNFTNRGGMRFRLIQPGNFCMGSGEKAMSRNESIRSHEVVISAPYYLAETPVTRGQWTSVMGTNPWAEDDPDAGRLEHPATHVSHIDATEYCERMAASSKLHYRLPTEAEWE
ncbi:MAG TPA: hypothetical protein DDZ51_12145, partial [Planctomycetaceae bacterium]|nr:hypothetical protein [Planctomycetaceae bacterium]